MEPNQEFQTLPLKLGQLSLISSGHSLKCFDQIIIITLKKYNSAQQTQPCYIRNNIHSVCKRSQCYFSVGFKTPTLSYRRKSKYEQCGLFSYPISSQNHILPAVFYTLSQKTLSSQPEEWLGIYREARPVWIIFYLSSKFLFL